MSIRRWVAVPLLPLLLSGAAQAVALNPQGQGQVLLYPYYTTLAGNVSLVTLTNHTDKAKIVGLRFAEGENGRTAAALQVYLAPFDSWSGSVFDRDDYRVPGLLSADTSCMHAAGFSDAALPLLPDGRAYLPFSEADSASDGDPGSRGTQRLREGYIEAVELATVREQTPSHSSIITRNCAALRAAWSIADGYWQAEPLRDLANPTGGLSGDVAIINPASGTAFGLAASALEDFRIDPADVPRGSSRSVAQNLRPDLHAASLLHSALSDPVARVATADVIADGRRLRLSYAQDNAVEAVSAVLTAAQLSSPFDTSADIGARTSFVLTYPTRFSYTDPRLLQSARLPFDRLFQGLQPLQQASGIAFRRFDRQGHTLEGGLPQEGCPHCPSYPLLRAPGTAVEVISTGGQRDPLLGSRLHGDFGFTFAGGAGIALQGTGWVMLELGDLSLYAYALEPSLEGYRLVGRPVIGTRVTHYASTQAQSGAPLALSVVTTMSAAAHCVDRGGADCKP